MLILDTTSGLVSAVDPNGNWIAVESDGIYASNGQSIAFERDGNDRITMVTKPDGSFITYEYSTEFAPQGDLVTVAYRAATDVPLSNPAGRIVYDYEYTEDTHYLLNSSEPGKEPFSVLEYDGDGRLIAMTDRTGLRTEIDNEVAGQQQITLSPSERTRTIHTFNDRGDPIREDIVGDGRTITTRSTFNSIGQRLTFTNALDHTWEKTYDEDTGDLLSYAGV